MKHLSAHLEDFDRKRGWYVDPASISNKERYALLRDQCFNLFTEAGELAQNITKGLRHGEDRMQGIQEELVDVLIFTMKCARLAEVDLEEAYFQKMHYNEKRYPPLEM